MLNNDRLLVQILLLALLGACTWVLAPFFSALFWAGVLAFASWPLMRLLTRALDGRETTAAAILTGCWMVLVAVPSCVFTAQVSTRLSPAPSACTPARRLSTR